MAKVRLPLLTCQRCGWQWTPRRADVRQCPNPRCHSVWWNKPKEVKEKTHD